MTTASVRDPHRRHQLPLLGVNGRSHTLQDQYSERRSRPAANTGDKFIIAVSFLGMSHKETRLRAGRAFLRLRDISRTKTPHGQQRGKAGYGSLSDEQDLRHS